MGCNNIFAVPALADQYVYDGVHTPANGDNFTLYPTKYLQRFRPLIKRKLGK
jgi:hypothetical protein